ncbi:MAG: putative zinc-binding metallopeptidase [Chromatiales bacterium]|nr:putative zinc-binding metallopeptidase [Chromatiales bacterium]
MKALHCGSCGQRVFFDSFTCVACGAALAFDPGALEMRASPAGTATWRDPHGQVRNACSNRGPHPVCNWLADPGSALCRSCELTELLPDLSRLDNMRLWARMELAKRRLLYTLIDLGLPLAWGDEGAALRFRFLEDRRRNPSVIEDFVTTGHLSGAITVNIVEADDAARHAAREQMQERYRTVLGHLRHEVGHYYFGWLINTPETVAEFRGLFGDERCDYAEALGAYYRDGPPADWPERYVSAYAAAHPHEDWAESFAHVLHIIDLVETARTFRLARPGGERPPGEWLEEWGALIVALNELNRSLGLEDAYPFVLTQPVIRRLVFIRRLIGHATAGLAVPAGAASPRTHS